MKVKIMATLFLLLGTAFGVARQFSGEPIPPCKPGVNCPILK